jgi:redox-sensitive bicupin YhaK (pirin superfamily)
MMVIRKDADRGHAHRGWLESWHSFSFADYYDPSHMGFDRLRVINEDIIQPSMGFGMHGHKDMEIVTYVLEGELAHKDTLGNSSVIRPGDIQRMSAGTGIEHSEFNNSKDQATHLLQIWLIPRSKNRRPDYEQLNYSKVLSTPGIHKVVSRDKSASMVTIGSDVEMYVGKVDGFSALFQIRPGRSAWLQLVKGEIAVKSSGGGASVGGVSVGGTVLLQKGDGLAITDEKELAIESKGPSEFLLFEMG